MRFLWSSLPRTVAESCGGSNRPTLPPRPLSGRPSVLEHAGHRVYDVLNRSKLFRMREQQTRHVERIRLTAGAHRQVFYALEVDHVSEAHDAPDHLAARETEHVGKQSIHVNVPRRLEPR